MAKIEPCIPEGMRHRVRRSLPLKVRHNGREPLKRLRIESQRLSNLACGGLTAIRDDIRCHRCAKLAIAAIDILNRLLALFLRWQIQIDVGPLTAAFREKPLKKQLHADRVDSSYFK